MRRFLLVLGLTAGFIAASSSGVPLARGATFSVCPSGCPYSSIQAAVDAAGTGDIITIARGRYSENVVVSKSLSLVGRGVTVDGCGHGSALTIAPGATVNVVGLSFTNGLADLGGGIANAGTLTLFDVTVSGNQAPASGPPPSDGGIPSGVGGGIANIGTLTVNNSTISNNHAGSFGGGLVNAPDASATLNNSSVTGNRSDMAGGGITNGGTLQLNNTRISENGAVDGGGGIQNFGVLNMVNGALQRNVAGGGGGGLGNSGQATLQNSRVIDNISGGNVGPDGDTGGGGGITNVGSLTLINTPVTGNRTGGIGGGIRNWDTRGGTVTLQNSPVRGNKPDDCVGVDCGPGAVTGQPSTAQGAGRNPATAGGTTRPCTQLPGTSRWQAPRRCRP